MAKKTHEQQAHPAEMAAVLIAGVQASGQAGERETTASTDATGSRAQSAIADEILERLANGETLTAICLEAGMPNRVTFYRWMDADARLRARYEDAIKVGTDVLGDLAHSVATGQRPVGDMVAVAATKLQLDAIKWVAAVRNPARYSERHTAHVTGQMAQDQTPAAPLRIDLAALSTDDLRTLEAINERALAPVGEESDA